jgi:apolipoprotein N-acyltransferase
MSRYLALSDRATGPGATGVADVTHLIWPESAFPFFLAKEADALDDIAKLLPPGTVLVTGAARVTEAEGVSSNLQAYNSVYVIDHEGTILSVYDKVHLVPFGEYLPFQHVLERLGLMQVTKLEGGYSAGDRHRSFAIPRAPKFTPLICYEIIFPADAIPHDDRPDWIINLTNDGWFGISTGPYQHFLQARVRVIEEGLPLVRAANTGISAVVDPFGRVIQSLPLGVEGVLDSALPTAIAPTLYARFGDRHIALALAAFLVVAIFRRSRRPRRHLT